MLASCDHNISINCTWYHPNKKLKVNVEVGPVPYENRLALLNELENQGITFRASGKLEGKKYTKIYTQSTFISDWTNKQKIVDGMERLYHDSELNSTFKKIALAVEKMEKVHETEELQAKTVHQTYTDLGKISERGFKLFAEKHGISPNDFQIRSRNASFLIPIFRELEQIYGMTREKWWWHDSTFTYWFDRLKDDRLKLTLELGPLHADQRLVIINRLEELGISFSYQSKLPTSRYTRLFSKSTVLNNWEDVEEVYKGMEELYNDPRNQEMIQMIETLK